VFTPKDKLADWMEAYATSQELNIWLSATLLPTPVYDEATKRWTVTVERSGKITTLRPAHIVLAMGTLGSKLVPEVPGIHEYSGVTMHASTFTSTQELGWEGKKVVVVGAGNTAAGVTIDLLSSKCTVTMLQRSPTYTVFPETLAAYWNYIAPPGVPTAIVDYKALSVPWLTRGKVIKSMRAMAEQYGVDPDASTEGDMRRKQALLSIGYRTIPDDYGLQGPFYRKLGGYR
jgi:cation diffusion facilitator CzcD-associated flavoprotein CzcO